MVIIKFWQGDQVIFQYEFKYIQKQFQIEIFFVLLFYLLTISFFFFF